MGKTFIRLGVAAMLASSTLAGPASAIESSAAGSMVQQSNINFVTNKIDSTNSTVESILACNASRKFYAPTDPKKDANGCVGVGDYDLNMGSTSNINLAGGLLGSNGSNSGNYLGRFQNTATAGYGVAGIGVNGYGVYGYSVNGQGVYGVSDYSWAGYFYGTNGSTNGYGLYATAPNYAIYANNSGNNNWTAVVNGGASPYGLNVTNNAANAMFCLNGNCTTSLPSISCNFPGSARTVYGDQKSGGGCWDDMTYYCNSSGQIYAMYINC